jgi:hypothetical protein
LAAKNPKGLRIGAAPNYAIAHLHHGLMAVLYLYPEIKFPRNSMLVPRDTVQHWRAARLPHSALTRCHEA